MSKEEPAWKAELRENLDEQFISSGAEIFDLVVPYIRAAEQRGFQAGVNKTGRAVGELRVKLRTARATALREAANHLESIDPIEFALGTVDAVREVLRMAKEAESQ